MWSAITGLVSTLVNIGIVVYNQIASKNARKKQRLSIILEDIYDRLNEASYVLQVSRIPNDFFDDIEKSINYCNDRVSNSSFLFSDSQKKIVGNAIGGINQLSEAVFEYDDLRSNQRSEHAKAENKMKKARSEADKNLKAFATLLSGLNS